MNDAQTLEFMRLISPSSETKEKLLAMAKEAWEEMPSVAQNRVRSVWRKMDTDCSDSVDRKELRKWIDKAVPFWVRVPKGLDAFLFKLCDADDSGDLDFDEAWLLLYMMGAMAAGYFNGLSTCSICKDLAGLEEDVYICPTCCARDEVDPDFALSTFQEGDPTCVCLSCMERHEGESLHKHKLVRVTPTLHKSHHEDPLVEQLVAECKCCGIEHKLLAGGYLKEKMQHMFPSGDGYLCEFCTLWMCKKCGSVGQEHSKPSPHMWMGTWKCGACLGETTFWASKFNPLPKARMERRAHCSACRQHVLNGTLHRRLDDSSASTGSSQGQQRQEDGSGMEALQTAVTAAEVGLKVAELVSQCSIM